MSTDDPNPALENLLAWVQTIVVEMDAGPDNDELGAFDELRNTDEGPGSTSETRARIAALPFVVAERLPDTVASRAPGGPLLHRAIARATRRQDEALLEEIRRLATQVKDRLLELTDTAWPSLSRSMERAMDQIHAVAAEVALMEGRFAAMLSRIEALESRLERPE